MTVLAAIEAVCLVAVVWLAFRHIQQHDQAIADERRELLTRIQRPELVPQGQAPFAWPAEDDEPDEFDQVGQILELAEPVEES